MRDPPAYGAIPINYERGTTTVQEKAEPNQIGLSGANRHFVCAKYHRTFKRFPDTRKSAVQSELPQTLAELLWRDLPAESGCPVGANDAI